MRHAGPRATRSWRAKNLLRHRRQQKAKSKADNKTAAQIYTTMMMKTLVARRAVAALTRGPAPRQMSAMVSLEYEFPG
jgi:hypothetical protein